mmetsp:Transcript_118117/g.330726  ORF Transcript_118117/g.330726 Transcript_118117/m.330726 type:complete len:421 (-) Transcript_118117:244-1506(-)
MPHFVTEHQLLRVRGRDLPLMQCVLEFLLSGLQRHLQVHPCLVGALILLDGGGQLLLQSDDLALDGRRALLEAPLQLGEPAMPLLGALPLLPAPRLEVAYHRLQLPQALSIRRCVPPTSFATQCELLRDAHARLEDDAVRSICLLGVDLLLHGRDDGQPHQTIACDVDSGCQRPRIAFVVGNIAEGVAPRLRLHHRRRSSPAFPQGGHGLRSGAAQPLQQLGATALALEAAPVALQDCLQRVQRPGGSVGALHRQLEQDAVVGEGPGERLDASVADPVEAQVYREQRQVAPESVGQLHDAVVAEAAVSQGEALQAGVLLDRGAPCVQRLPARAHIIAVERQCSQGAEAGTHCAGDCDRDRGPTPKAREVHEARGAQVPEVVDELSGARTIELPMAQDEGVRVGGGLDLHLQCLPTLRSSR